MHFTELRARLTKTQNGELAKGPDSFFPSPSLAHLLLLLSSRTAQSPCCCCFTSSSSCMCNEIATTPLLWVSMDEGRRIKSRGGWRSGIWWRRGQMKWLILLCSLPCIVLSLSSSTLYTATATSHCALVAPAQKRVRFKGWKYQSQEPPLFMSSQCHSTGGSRPVIFQSLFADLRRYNRTTRRKQ